MLRQEVEHIDTRYNTEVSPGMDAHFTFRSLRIALLLWVMTTAAVQAAQYETRNFTISGAPTARMAKDFGETAERCRYEMAVLWLGKPMPDWSQKCPIRVTVGEQLGAGGATTFIFQGGEVFDWEMDIQGSAKRILDSVLPHEITHMVLASHFRQPVPRWLDEGAATSVEHVSEKENYRNMLRHFLREDVKKCLPFRRMVGLKEYPSDPMPFYAQGFSVVEYLLALGNQLDNDGHRRLVRFTETALESGNWDLALRTHYEIENLGELQRDRWIAWLEAGSPKGNDLLTLLPNPNSSTADTLESLVDEPLPLNPTPTGSQIALVSARPSPPYGKSIYENLGSNAVVPIPALGEEGTKVVPIPTTTHDSTAHGWVGADSTILIDSRQRTTIR